MPLIQKLALSTLLITLCLVAVGGFTRGSSSGFGCGDRWPLCDGGALGGLFPRAEFHMIVEWSHRWLAGTVGILALVTAGVAIRTRSHDRRVLLPAVLAVVAIGLQAYLGRLVVKGSLDADLVSAHFMLSMVVVGLLAVLSVNAGCEPRSPHLVDLHDADLHRVDLHDVGPRGEQDGEPAPAHPSRWWLAVAAAAAGSLLVAFVGSVVHDRFLPGWPLVNVGAATDAGASGGTVALHTLHRTLAGVELAALVFLWLAARRLGSPRSEQLLIAAAVACYAVGAVLGAGHVAVGMRSSGLVFAHLAIAESAWAALVAATTLALRNRELLPEAPDSTRRAVASVGGS